jgi:FKBP-type peptidyl-prolyl cis-trans isomerase FklB
MRTFFLLAASGLAAPLVLAHAQDPAASPAPADPPSYIIGTNIAGNLKEQGVDINLESLLAGMKDVLEGDGSRFSAAEAQEIMTRFQETLQEKAQKGAAEAGARNANEGAEFLKKNSTREGVKSTASGLQYEVIKEGTGPKPTAADTVRVHYHGTLLDGKVFDSSVERDEPAQFPLNGVIKGWTEGLQLMPTGAKYRFFIPSNLAYGERGAGSDIGPNAVLTFEVELLEIVK